MTSRYWIGTLFVDYVESVSDAGLLFRTIFGLDRSDDSDGGVAGTPTLTPINSIRLRANLRWITGQLELCPSTKRYHIQFYGVTHKPVRLPGAKRLMGGDQVHLEQRRGSHNQAVEYCNKESTRVAGPFCLGEPILPSGTRTDLLALKESLDSGSNIHTIADEFFGVFCRYRNSIEAYISLKQDRRSWPMENFIYWGTAGTGKTRRAYAEATEMGVEVYELPQNDGGTPWFCGYNGEHTLLIDDFYGWLKISFLLKLLDRYPMQVQIKGGMRHFVSKKIVFTSNVEPTKWFKWGEKEPEIYNAMKRRYTKVIHFHDGVEEEWFWPEHKDIVKADAPIPAQLVNWGTH